ncbi:MAG: threonine synthase [Chloroflexota bacterium]|nr:threonine synthase [Chloroflexota bacterium]
MCQSPLELDYLGPFPILRDQFMGLWALDVPSPLHDPANVVSLGEGNTPCLPLENIGNALGLASIFGKLEFQSPTGSFKDRGTTVLISALKELGITQVVEDSSGNAGASLAAYAAKAGIVSHIFVPASAPSAKIQQIMVYGAQIHLVDGTRDAATKAGIAYAKNHGLCIASHNMSPYYIEGTKTIAYEIVQQMKGSLPKHIVMPVGNGSLLIGAWKGFRELQSRGVISTIPQLHAIQSEAVKPIVAAFAGETWAPSEQAKTIAGGITVGQPPRLNQCLNAISHSKGQAVAVTDDRIRTWQLALAQREGIYAEPTSAAAFAGVEMLIGQGHIGSRDTVLVPITGMGLKDPVTA